MRVFLLLNFILPLGLYGQAKFEPAVLFIHPRQVNVADGVATEVAEYTKKVEITDELRRTYIPEGLPPNWKIVRTKELEYIHQQDLETILMITLVRELTYFENDHHDNVLIYPVREQPENEYAAYISIGDRHGMSWIVDVYAMDFFKQGKDRQLSLHVRLFNIPTKYIYLDEVYSLSVSESKISDVETPPCTEDEWICLEQKIAKVVARELAHVIDKNRHHHR